MAAAAAAVGSGERGDICEDSVHAAVMAISSLDGKALLDNDGNSKVGSNSSKVGSNVSNRKNSIGNDSIFNNSGHSLQMLESAAYFMADDLDGTTTKVGIQLPNTNSRSDYSDIDCANILRDLNNENIMRDGLRDDGSRNSSGGGSKMLEVLFNSKHLNSNDGNGGGECPPVSRNRLESWGGMSDLSMGGARMIDDEMHAALTATALQETGIIDDIMGAAASINVPSPLHSPNSSIVSDSILPDSDSHSLSRLMLPPPAKNERLDIPQSSSSIASLDQLPSILSQPLPEVTHLLSPQSKSNKSKNLLNTNNTPSTIDTIKNPVGQSSSTKAPISLQCDLNAIVAAAISAANGHFMDQTNAALAVCNQKPQTTCVKHQKGGLANTIASVGNSITSGTPTQNTQALHCLSSSICQPKYNNKSSGLTKNAVCDVATLAAIKVQEAMHGGKKPDNIPSTVDLSKRPSKLPSLPSHITAPPWKAPIKYQTPLKTGTTIRREPVIKTGHGQKFKSLYTTPIKQQKNNNSLNVHDERTPLTSNTTFSKIHIDNSKRRIEASIQTPTKKKCKTSKTRTTPGTPGTPNTSSGSQSNQKWEDMFACLIEYVKLRHTEGKKDSSSLHTLPDDCSKLEWDGNVPTTYKTKDGKALGRWINNQRSAKHKGVLKLDRELRLVSTGLKWSVLSTNAWPDMMNELRLYVKDKTKNGQKWDGNVPTNYRIKSNIADDGSEIDEEKNLGRWINRQRSLYQGGRLKKERQLELEKIGLKWSVLSTTSWETMYNALCKYAKKKRDADPCRRWDGNCPANYKTEDQKSLGRWVNRQRSAYAKRKLKSEWVEKLNAIGLKWSVHERKNTNSNSQTVGLTTTAMSSTEDRKNNSLDNSLVESKKSLKISKTSKKSKSKCTSVGLATPAHDNNAKSSSTTRCLTGTENTTSSSRFAPKIAHSENGVCPISEKNMLSSSTPKSSVLSPVNDTTQHLTNARVKEVSVDLPIQNSDSNCEGKGDDINVISSVARFVEV